MRSAVCLHIWSIPGGQTNVTLKRNSHYFRLICKNWPLTLITASHCGGLGAGLYSFLPGVQESCAVLKYYFLIIPDLLIQWHLMVVTLERMGHGDETIHCDTLAIVVIVSPPTPRHCVLCHLPGLALWRWYNNRTRFTNPFNSNRTIFSWLKFIICKLMVTWCWKHPCIAGC